MRLTGEELALRDRFAVSIAQNPRRLWDRVDIFAQGPTHAQAALLIYECADALIAERRRRMAQGVEITRDGYQEEICPNCGDATRPAIGPVDITCDRCDCRWREVPDE